MVHQCAQFSKDPRKSHGEAVNRIGRYFKATEKMVIYISPCENNINLWSDADFGGNWFPEEAKYDSDMARSRSGFVVSYLGCPVMWKSQLQTDISLISNDSEYIVIIKALHNTINIIDIIKLTKSLGYNVGTVLPTGLCKLSEDNIGALTLYRDPAMRPRTKNINLKYHHLSAYIANYTVSIISIYSSKKPVDMLT